MHDSSPPNESQIKGIIGYLGLQSFWCSCTPEEQESLIRHYQGGFSITPVESPIEGNIKYSFSTKLKYLTATLGWTVYKKNFTLSNKIIDAGKELIHGDVNALDVHYFCEQAASCYYKQRKFRPDAVDLTMYFCLRDIELFPEYAKLMQSQYDYVPPKIMTFQQLAILYEKQGQYQKAIEICDLAMSYGLEDTTQGGYPARVEKLQRKLNR